MFLKDKGIDEKKLNLARAFSTYISKPNQDMNTQNKRTCAPYLSDFELFIRNNYKRASTVVAKDREQLTRFPADLGCNVFDIVDRFNADTSADNWYICGHYWVFNPRVDESISLQHRNDSFNFCSAAYRVSELSIYVSRNTGLMCFELEKDNKKHSGNVLVTKDGIFMIGFDSQERDGFSLYIGRNNTDEIRDNQRDLVILGMKLNKFEMPVSIGNDMRSALVAAAGRFVFERRSGAPSEETPTMPKSSTAKTWLQGGSTGVVL